MMILDITRLLGNKCNTAKLLRLVNRNTNNLIPIVNRNIYNLYNNFHWLCLPNEIFLKKQITLCLMIYLKRNVVNIFILFFALWAIQAFCSFY
jgi:hypothetical protein